MDVKGTYTTFHADRFENCGNREAARIVFKVDDRTIFLIMCSSLISFEVMEKDAIEDNKEDSS